MSMILSDSNGYICELESATESKALMDWLFQAGTPEIEVFCAVNLSEFPQELADEIDAFILRSRPPKNLVDLVNSLVAALRRSTGFLVMEM